MKKLVALALGAVLCIALSIPAQAETKVNFSGWYRVLHHNLVNFNRAADGDLVQSDSFFEHRLNLNIDFKPTEDLLIHWTLRAPNVARWGSSVQGSSNAYTVNTRAIYATITQDWGKLSIGRLEEMFPTAQNGLKSLGYTYGTTYIYTNPFDYKQVVDGIVYQNTWDNGFGLNVYYAKANTFDPGNTLDNNGVTDKDVDFDRYGIEPTYKWDGGGVALNLEYQRDMMNTATVKNHAFFVNPAIMHSWGDFSIRFEGKIGWGETETLNANNVRTKTKAEGLGLYLQASYNYGDGDINLLGWFADGTSQNDDKSHNLVGMGDFAPFLVAYYNVTLSGRIGTHGGGTYGQSMYGTNATRGSLGSSAGGGTRGGTTGPNNHWGIGLLGNHNFAKNIRFNWGIGAFRLVEETYRGQSKDLGVEIDVGIRVGLLQGVTFESQFGYMFNGEAWENGIQGNAASYRDAKDTYAWLNALQFSF
jgi:hypothetical protein